MPKDREPLRCVLRENLRKLMESNNSEGQTDLHKRTGVAQSTIGRILADEGENTRIDTLERIAKAYGLQAWQLLIPNVNPKNPPMLRVPGETEKALYARLEDAFAALKNLQQ